MNSDNLNLLMELFLKKIDFISTIANIGMLWWVSSVVFCGTTLAMAWQHKKTIETLPPDLLKWLKRGLTFFFSSIVFFGLFTIFIVYKLYNESQEIFIILNQKETLPPFEYIMVGGGLLIGTTSFIFVTIFWIKQSYQIESNKQIIKDRPIK